jgi:hypothetical protein
MHYKNGREARENDPVILEGYQGKFVAGTIHSLNANATSCNGQVAYAVPGGVNHTCVTVGDCLHAEDAFRAAVPAPVTPSQTSA